MVVKGMVTIYCLGQGDRRVKRAVGWLVRNDIDYQLKEINEDNFSFNTFLKFLEMTVDGITEILTTKGGGYRDKVLKGEYADESLSSIYKIILDDPEYLDLPLMIDDLGRTATLGTKRGLNDYENMTVFTKTEPIVIKDEENKED